MSKKRKTISLDKMGMCTSAICMLHCLSIPLFLVFGFKSLLELIDQEWLEWGLIGLALVTGITSFISGFFAHKQHFIPVLFVAGFLLLVNAESVAHIWGSAGLSVAGAMIIVYAHVQNLKWKNYAFSN